MRVEFGTLTITEKTKELVNNVLETGNVSSGIYVDELEEKFAEFVGSKFAIAVSTGTDAISVALSSLYEYGANRGDEVIVPALSFIASANAVLHAGFTPVFVDVDINTLNINVNKIVEKITEKTIAILPVHLMGKPVDIDSIERIAIIHNLWIIQDAAEAHGAIYKNRKIGSIPDMTCYSLYTSHIISSGEGGMIVTDNKELVPILKQLRNHGRAYDFETYNSNPNKYIERTGKLDVRFIFDKIGYSSKMNELEAAVGIGTMEIANQIIETRRNNLYYFMTVFSDFQRYFYPYSKEPHEEFGPHAFPIVIKEDVDFTREDLTHFLIENSIDSRTLFSSIPTQCNGYKFLKHKLGDFPNAELIGNNGFHIGIHQNIDREDREFVIEKILEFLD